MKAMILAAGKGTRVRPLTHELPKPMIPLLGKPVMEYLVEELVRHGFTDIMVNTSHLSDKLEHYFGDGRRWGAQIGYSFEGYIEEGEVVATPIGSAGGLKKIQEFSGFFDDTFLVVCGDALIDLDLTKAIRQHWQKRALASVVVQEVPHERVSNYGVVVCDQDGRISSFQEKPTPSEARSNLVNTGIYIFEPSVLDRIPPSADYDIGSQLLPQLIQEGVPFYALNEPFTWIDIGRLSDYWDASQQLMRGELRDIQMPGRQVRAGVWTGLNVSVDWEGVDVQGPVYVGASSRIEPGVRIVGPTWIGNGCHIQSGVQLSRSIVFEHTRIRSHAKIDEAVVFGRHCVDKEGNPVLGHAADLDWVGDARDLGSLGAAASS